MIKSYIDPVSIVNDIKESKLGAVLSKTNVFIETMVRNGYDKRIGVWGKDNKEYVTIVIWPLLYNETELPKDGLIQYRTDAVYTLFKRWTLEGLNKRHAKDPFSSKAFQNYLDDICFNEADFLLLRVPDFIDKSEDR